MLTLCFFVDSERSQTNAEQHNPAHADGAWTTIVTRAIPLALPPRVAHLGLSPTSVSTDRPKFVLESHSPIVAHYSSGGANLYSLTVPFPSVNASSTGNIGTSTQCDVA